MRESRGREYAGAEMVAETCPIGAQTVSERCRLRHPCQLGKAERKASRDMEFYRSAPVCDVEDSLRQQHHDSNAVKKSKQNCFNRQNGESQNICDMISSFCSNYIHRFSF